MLHLFNHVLLGRAQSVTAAMAIFLGAPFGTQALGQDFLQFSRSDALETIGDGLTSVTIGPDNDIYFTGRDGDVFRRGRGPGATTVQVYESTPDNNASGTGTISLLGFAFTPNATADNLEAVITFSDRGRDTDAIANNPFTSRLSAINLSDAPPSRRDLIVGLPSQSTGDQGHSINRPCSRRMAGCFLMSVVRPAGGSPRTGHSGATTNWLPMATPYPKAY